MSSHELTRRHGVGLWAVAFAFLAVLAFSTAPTPLYAIYQERDGFSTFLITVIFAAYAVGVTLALFFAGHLSDSLGRKRMLIPALLLSLVSATLFLVWRDLPGLLVARVINGLSVGIVTATATAYLADCTHRPSAPRCSRQPRTSADSGSVRSSPARSRRPSTRRSPSRMCFFAALLVVAVIVVALAPETVTRPADPPRLPAAADRRPGRGALLLLRRRDRRVRLLRGLRALHVARAVLPGGHARPHQPRARGCPGVDRLRRRDPHAVGRGRVGRQAARRAPAPQRSRPVSRCSSPHCGRRALRSSSSAA